jgi:hypothetical protein
MQEKVKLCFLIELKAHPYPQDSYSRLEVWGEFSIAIQTVTNSVIQLTSWEWDVLGFKNWFLQHKETIQNEQLLVDGYTPNSTESIAQALRRFYARFPTNNDETIPISEEEYHWYDLLFNYRERHCLNFGFRGIKIPTIYIGLNRGLGEISTTDGAEWDYTFDMGEFCNNLLEQLEKVDLTNRL